MKKTTYSFLLVILALSCQRSAQVADKSFTPVVEVPTYPIDQGPMVVIDEGHFNFHTINGRYQGFVKVLKLDGYRVTPNKGIFDGDALSVGKILVIANALHESNERVWALPTPSAFTDLEIDAVVEWVANSGALLLIADHMPFPGAASSLAKRFGIEFTNGFAIDEADKAALATFARDNNTLISHSIISGRGGSEKIDSVISFTGQAFNIEASVQPLLKLPNGYVNLTPDTSWQLFDEKTPRASTDGMFQGAVLNYKRGRVAVFGEAAMFTSQISGGGIPMGMNSPLAPQNQQFLLNVIHWLDGLLD